MTDTLPPAGAIPPDDPARQLAVARPDIDESFEHLGVVGDTYTILLSGADTAGRYALIDMHVPPPQHELAAGPQLELVDPGLGGAAELGEQLRGLWRPV